MKVPLDTHVKNLSKKICNQIFKHWLKCKDCKRCKECKDDVIEWWKKCKKCKNCPIIVTNVRNYLRTVGVILNT